MKSFTETVGLTELPGYKIYNWSLIPDIHLIILYKALSREKLWL